MKQETHPTWTAFILFLLGLWLLAAPASFHVESTPLVINDFLSGIAIILLSLSFRRKQSASVLWIMAAIGAWLQFAPLLFWAPEAATYLNNLFVGSLIIVFSVILFPLPGQIPDEEPSIPPGWTYNPSAWAQRIPIALLAYLCWMASRYLACYQLGYIDVVWDPFFTPGTPAVLESSVSKMFPVADAGLGAFAYTLEFFFTIQGGKARWRTSPWGVLIFGILVIPVGLTSITLIILQPLAVGTWCTLCLVTAICMLLAIPLAIDEVIASLQYLRHSKEKPFLTLLFKGGMCPQAISDKRTPSLDQSLPRLLKASLWGNTLPWNLTLSSLLGILVMALPTYLGIQGILYDLDPILGAFTTAVSVLSYSEFLRKLRYLNLLFMIILFIASIFSASYMLLHMGLAIVIALLAFRKGPVHEKGIYIS